MATTGECQARPCAVAADENWSPDHTKEEALTIKAARNTKQRSNRHSKSASQFGGGRPGDGCAKSAIQVINTEGFNTGYADHTEENTARRMKGRSEGSESFQPLFPPL
jgi:hypothetical protein